MRIALIHCNLEIDPRNLPRALFGEIGAPEAEIAVRQYLLIRIAGSGLYQAMLRALGKPGGRLIYPMPLIWRQAIERQGFLEVDHGKSASLWALYVAACYGFGVLCIARQLVFGLFPQDKKYLPIGKSVYFVNLQRNNLPLSAGDQMSQSIVTWYLGWPGRVSGLKYLRHSVSGVGAQLHGDVSVVCQSAPFPLPFGFYRWFAHFAWGIKALVVVLAAAMRGQWWQALMLNQAADRALVKTAPAGGLAQDYLFSNSSAIYRPLWTYEAERRGAQITLYFYSTNCERTKFNAVYAPDYSGYAIMSWSRYLVWDKYQAEFIQRNVGGGVEVLIVGPIDFCGRAVAVPSSDKLRFSVFDVTPFRSAVYQGLGAEKEFYTADYSIKFLLDIIKAAEDFDVEILWKRKRDIGKLAHPAYRRLVERLAHMPRVIQVDSGASPQGIIAGSIGAISSPFTSTALTAQSMNSPSVYYDATGLVDPTDRAAHGIKVVDDVSGIRQWMQEVIRERCGEK